jgi:hypothetical protein
MKKQSSNEDDMKLTRQKRRNTFGPSDYAHLESKRQNTNKKSDLSFNKSFDDMNESKYVN